MNNVAYVGSQTSMFKPGFNNIAATRSFFAVAKNCESAV